MDEVDELVRDFLVESSDSLDRLDRDLLALEAEPDSRDILSSAFRAIHTIKGTSGFLAFNRLEQLTHTGESLMSRLRDGEQAMTTPTADALLQMVDAVRVLLASIEATGAEGDVEVAPVLAQLRAQMSERAGDPSAQRDEAGATPPVVADAPSTALRRSAAEGTLRVDVEVLDTLMRLIGELAVTRDRLVRVAHASPDPVLTDAARRLSTITTDLQDGILKTRMQPIDHLWSRLPRIVRDLGVQCGCRVRLAMTGQEIELDRAVLEAIKDPLTHLVRNAIDHGIEPAAAREAAGKPAVGVLSLRARHDEGQVVVEVADDGAGMNPGRIAAKAVERGLRTAAQLARMSEAEVLQLVFEPGFSTAAAVTNVSGRGVGMDVVRTNVEAVGGTIEIESAPGEGTTCRLRVPLTLPIPPAAL